MDKSRYFYPVEMGTQDPETVREAVRKLCPGHGGIIRTAQAFEAGVHPRTVYGLRDSGFFERLERGEYRSREI